MSQYPPDVQRSGPSAPLFDGTQACAGADLSLFFPTKGGHNRAAKAVCARCRFRLPCLDYAMARQPGLPSPGYVAGVWGGTTAVERDHLRRQTLAVAS